MSKGENMVEVVAQIPKDQRFTWRLVPLAGRLLDAETVGKTLTSVCEILKAMDKTGREVFPALVGIRLADDGTFEADVAILPVEPALSQPNDEGEGK
jgi:hypothetical protein